MPFFIFLGIFPSEAVKRVGLVWRGGGNCVNNKTFLINSIFRIKAAPNFIFDRGFPVSSQNKRREKVKITEKCKNAWQQPYMQKTCDVAEKAILAKKKLRKKCVNRDKM